MPFSYHSETFLGMPGDLLTYFSPKLSTDRTKISGNPLKQADLARISRKHFKLLTVMTFKRA